MILFRAMPRLMLVLILLFNNGKGIRFKDGAYHEIIVDIRETVPFKNCNTVLQHLETTLIEASAHLYMALGGRAYFGSININLPITWSEDCVPINRHVKVSNGELSDITITLSHPLFGNKIWTQQSGGCGEQGDQIFIPYRGLEEKLSGKYFTKEWAKYRYGVFDEIGYDDDKIYPKCHFTDTQHVTGCSDGIIKDAGICQSRNPFADMIKTIDKRARSSLLFVPEAPNIMMFCDETNHHRYAPTKQNLLCNRRSTLDVIFTHSDFVFKSSINVLKTNLSKTMPVFIYNRRLLTRYVVIIDNSQNVLVRESWSFLRNALRKWVMFDLNSNTEIGILLTNGFTIDQVLEISKLEEHKDRDKVASFIPYAPSDSYDSPCITCAVREALEMLSNRRNSHGRSNDVILVFAPGMEHSVDFEDALNLAVANKAKICTVNFPGIVHRQPLDIMATLTGGLSFTINESRYNSEKSLLNTYFELSFTLFHISQTYYEGPKHRLPIEIHRNILMDTEYNKSSSAKRGSRIFSGSFYLDANLSSSSEFFIYTHNPEIPLIQNAQLIGPTGLVYETRSDQRMPIKQLTLVADLNQIGLWNYKIERFNSNSQPHFVQVFASPTSAFAEVVLAKVWYRRPKTGGPMILYCEIKRGDSPVSSAMVSVTAYRVDIGCNQSTCSNTLQLFDSGSGDPDITKNDGIYSRYYSANNGPGIYKFEFTINDNGNMARALPTNSTPLDLPCCGNSVIPYHETRVLNSFIRYVAPITVTITNEDIYQEKTIVAGKIRDLSITYIEEGKILLKWTSPDMGGHNVARYEIKYAFNILDIVDNYESAAIAWTHNNLYPYSAGNASSCTLAIDFEPSLFGRAVFFALHPFSKLMNNDSDSLISNPARIFIPNKIVPTNPPKNRSVNDTDNYYGNDVYDAENDKKFKRVISEEMHKYFVPIVAGFIFVVSLTCSYCILWQYRCYKRNLQQQQQLRQENPEQYPLEANLNAHNLRDINLEDSVNDNDRSENGDDGSDDNHAESNTNNGENGSSKPAEY